MRHCRARLIPASFKQIRSAFQNMWLFGPSAGAQRYPILSFMGAEVACHKACRWGVGPQPGPGLNSALLYDYAGES